MRRIRTRLITAFLFITLLPAVPLSLVVRDLLQRSFGPSLDANLESALEAGLAESRDRLSDLKTELKEVAAGLAPAAIDDRDSRPEPTVVLLDVDGRRVPSGRVPAEVLALTDTGSSPSRTDRAEPIRIGSYLVVTRVEAGAAPLIVARSLPDSLVDRAARMGEALGLIRTLQEDRPRILRSYVVPFLLVYAVLILIAVGVGALLARRLARPLEALVAGTRKVAAGDLQTRVTVAAAGEVADLVGAFNGMVDRLAAQRSRLARLERVTAWRDLARTLAHEIKNPLTPILLAVQSVKDSYRGQDTEHRAMLADCEGIVREEVEALRLLVKEFSEFARLPEPRPEPGDLARLLQELSHLYGSERVVSEVHDGRLAAFFDAAELRRALINLIDNGLTACTAAGKRERVDLYGRRATASRAHSDRALADPAGPGEVIIEVVDAGIGIQPQDLPRIFEPNFSTGTEGMGLGLCIVEGIVTAHGGTIEVESRPGSGTRFTIRLPATAPDTRSPDPTADAGSVVRQGGER